MSGATVPGCAQVCLRWQLRRHRAYAASNAPYFFAFTGPPAALGGLAAGAALASASSPGRR
ncbi:MAG: hypothetical protein AVDCRST_MAG03-3645 [uncultured Rubrobacteraceae bacterium]|uniref:Uncharacterized protein n=1 Tax=uncultured Rubrobacteraceae bacterium TaxID=349277 RepID=A0A6J4QFS6_9ACTN|nr:MAG: hypothetical protein AVDCRST_MAG03-3645 [uncultured Rubrobacteraceae bacterium]